jgi:hypothetical protein
MARGSEPEPLPGETRTRRPRTLPIAALAASLALSLAECDRDGPPGAVEEPETVQLAARPLDHEGVLRSFHWTIQVPEQAEIECRLGVHGPPQPQLPRTPAEW